MKERKAAQIVIYKDDEEYFDVYSEQGIESCSDDDSISIEEAGFMQGYLAA